MLPIERAGELKLTGDNVLFSNDAFGQHYASELMYNDPVNQRRD
jgi:flavorubredoxin